MCARVAYKCSGVRAERNAHGVASPPTVADRVSPTYRRRQAVARRRLSPLAPAHSAPPAMNINKLFRPGLNCSQKIFCNIRSTGAYNVLDYAKHLSAIAVSRKVVFLTGRPAAPPRPRRHCLERVRLLATVKSDIIFLNG